MYQNKDGQFDNKVNGHIVTSDYSGSFSVIGVKAIVADILDKTQDLNYWIWYQRPSPTAGITPDAIKALIKRYQHIDRQGCVGLGILNQNVLVRSFKLPNDHSIGFPVLISKNEQKLSDFFSKLITQKANVAKATLDNERFNSFLSDSTQIKEKFDMSYQLMGMTQAQAHAIVGIEKEHRGEFNNEQLQLMQALTVCERLLSFKFENQIEKQNEWLDTYLSKSASTPRNMMQTKEGLYLLLEIIKDSHEQAA